MSCSKPLYVALTLFAALNHGLVEGQTPPMGWNSYNTYGCNPSEDIMKSNARAVVELGLADLGYTTVTTDCGWPASERDAEGKLQWNETLFPSGPKALGDYIHDIGLGFGLYSGAGYLQCGDHPLPASLGYEDIDAQSFAEWGGDSLKYDNCYSTSNTTMVDADSEEAQSSTRFEKMAESLENSGRDIAYWICQWGIGKDVPQWAGAIGETWRMSNDIYDDWRSIWRIVNQAVPHVRYSQPGAFADLDMLIVGLGGLTTQEEQFHFGLWSVLKSPLLIGAELASNSTPASSLAILSNEEVIAIDQDPLGEAAELVLRYTEEEWDLWAGNLSDNRKVIGIANWLNESQTVSLDLASTLGFASADEVRDVWGATDLGSVDFILDDNMREVQLEAHELRIWVLTEVEVDESLRFESSGYYAVHDEDSVTISGPAYLEDCQPCAPEGNVVRDIGPEAKVRFEGVTVSSDGSKFVGVDFVNYDYAFHSAWGLGTNTRNMTIAVNNNEPKRWAFPLSGNNWSESGRILIELEGFEEGEENEVVFGGIPGNTWAPDLVGFELFE